MHEQPEPMTTSWPKLTTRPDGRIELCFEPLDPPRDYNVGWLLVRDWLIADRGAQFTEAFESPTYEWYAKFTAPTPRGPALASLCWCDFPDMLYLLPESPEHNDFIRDTAERLRQAPPDFGSLKTTSGRAWKAWMASLGSCDYDS